MTSTPEFREAQEHKRECHGCEKCGRAESNALYSNQHEGIYLCFSCFQETPIGAAWIPEEGDVETKELLKLAEKILKYVEANADNPKKIKEAIQRYREKRNG